MSCGMDKYTAKPIQKQDIREALTNVSWLVELAVVGPGYLQYTRTHPYARRNQHVSVRRCFHQMVNSIWCHVYVKSFVAQRDCSVTKCDGIDHKLIGHPAISTWM